MTLEELEKAALNLSQEEKIQLAESIMIDVHKNIDPEIEKEWIVESKRRYREFMDGKINAIPAAEVFAALEKKFDEKNSVSSAG